MNRVLHKTTVYGGMSPIASAPGDVFGWASAFVLINPMTYVGHLEKSPNGVDLDSAVLTTYVPRNEIDSIWGFFEVPHIIFNR